MKNAVMYCRCASKDPDDIKHSINRQKELCHQWLKTNEYSMKQFYFDIGSSTRHPFIRDGFSRLIRDIQHSDTEIQIIVVSSSDRISRNDIDFLDVQRLVRRSNVQLVIIE